MHIGGIYKQYLKAMALMGQAIKLPGSKPSSFAEPGNTPALSAAELDRLATRAGDHYRALGTLVGLLGIAIVFLAIAPVGMHFESETEHLLGWLKVGLMAVMLLIVFAGSRGNLKGVWMYWRLKAEEARYEHLVTAAEQLRQTSNPTTHEALCDELIAVLVGDEGQIAYDEGKQEQYEDIESFADVLLWISVLLAFCGAVLHQFYHYNWLIFLTAFGPAMVGGFHGINAFLCVGELAKKHALYAKKLTSCLDSLTILRDAKSHDIPALLKLAEEVQAVLTERGDKWEKLVAEVRIQPA